MISYSVFQSHSLYNKWGERERERWYSSVTRRTGRRRARVKENGREIDPTRPDKHDKPFNRRLCTHVAISKTHNSIIWHFPAPPKLVYNSSISIFAPHSSRLALLSLSNTQRRRVRAIHEGQSFFSIYKQAHGSLLLMNIYTAASHIHVLQYGYSSHTYTEGQHTRGNTLSKSQ